MSVIASTNERLSARQRYVNPFRPHFERWPAVAWSATTAILVLEMLSDDAPHLLLLGLAIICAVMAFPWVRQSLRLMEVRDRMREHEVTVLPISKARAHFHEDGKRIFIGWGFDWRLDEAQLAREVALADPTKLAPAENIESPGQSWLHGVGMQEAPIYLPVVDEHTLIVAMTRWGKTLLFRMLITQAIQRGESVFVFDPKGDRGLREAAEQACHDAGQELLIFNPAFPKTSIRLDPMRNYDDAAELASRVAAQLGHSARDQNFTSFSFMLLNNVINGMLLADQRPTLAAIKRYLDGGLAELLVMAITAHCTRIFEPGWQRSLDNFRRTVVGRRKKPTADGDAALILTPEEEAQAIMAYYRENVAGTPHSSPEIEGLIATVEHPADHRSKMTAGLMPVLTKLTSGPLARLLSTDITDPGDTRMITDTKRIIEQQRTVYIGLNSLGNEDVANAIGEILLADLAAVCGSRYNYSTDKKVVSIFVDEAPEILNAPLIKLLNKGGGAGFRLTLATQTISDIVARLGDQATAEKVIGNIANFIFGRVTSTDSQEFFCDRLPRVPIKQLDYSRSITSPTDDPLSYSTSQGETLKTTMEPPIEPPTLGALPKFHYFALIGSRFVKGRIPVVIPDSK